MRHRIKIAFGSALLFWMAWASFTLWLLFNIYGGK